MRDIPQHMPAARKHSTKLSYEERAQLDAIIDLLIPSGEGFPPPSSLHLIDEFLDSLLPGTEHKTTLTLSEKLLHAVLRDLNASAGGRFCSASMELQQKLLRHLEQRDPAFFQTLWTLANHSYYTRLAIRQRSSLS